MQQDKRVIITAKPSDLSRRAERLYGPNLPRLAGRVRPSLQRSPELVEGRSVITAKRHYKSNGFTLIEAIVVLAIIGLIAALITVNVQLNRNRHKLTRAAQELALNIRRAQNMAMSGQLQFVGVPYGYGLHSLSDREYIIFYQTGSSDPTQGCKNYFYNLPDKITLPERMSLSPKDQCVYFVPPDPKTYINGLNSGSLTFTLTIDGLSKKVIVDASGRVEVK